MTAPETFTTVFKAILDEGAPSRHVRYVRFAVVHYVAVGGASRDRVLTLARLAAAREPQNDVAGALAGTGQRSVGQGSFVIDEEPDAASPVKLRRLRIVAGDPVLLLAARHDPERVVRQGPLQFEGLGRIGREPLVDYPFPGGVIQNGCVSV